MGFSTVEIQKENAKRFYRVKNIESASDVKWFYELPKYKNVKRVYETDKKPKTIIFEFQSYPCIFIEVLKY